MTRVYIIGAGLAGLSAAVTLSRSGRAVALYEASGQAGGRCRSFFDTSLNRVIDNGNHLLLTGNQYTMSYLRDIDAVDALVGPTPASFPFLDLRTGQRWSLQPSEGRIPWWILDPRRRVPGTRLWDYRSGLRFAVAGSGRTVSDCVGDRGALIEKFWEPLAIATLNSPLQTGAASLLWPVLREILGGGEAACRPRIARTGLSPTFVDPAIALLHRHGAHVRFGTRLRTITYEDAKARVLDFGTETVALEDGDSVVLALPPQAAMNLVPDLTVPEESHAIINAHFRLPEVKSLPAGLPFLGLIGGTAQWLFVRGDVASITISAANHMVDEKPELIARKTWRDVALALVQEADPLPPYRVVKEKRATFAQTPAQVRLRPRTRSRFINLYLAGDWIDTGLPATIEGAVRSGQMAARIIESERSPTPH